VGGQLHAPVPVTRWVGGWVAPRAGLDEAAKRKSNLFYGP